MTIATRSIVKAFANVEQQLSEVLDVIPFVQPHFDVWSPVLVPCIFDACSQLDSLWKSVNLAAGRSTIKDHHHSHRDEVADRWLIIWSDTGHVVRPFSAWAMGASWIDGQSTPSWCNAYNKLKHIRWANVEEATVKNAVDAVAALFLALARLPMCYEAMVEAGWLHTCMATSYVLAHTDHKQEPTGAGMTWESSRFSYAAGSHHPEFPSHLAYYHGCSRRFGKWLEGHYSRQFYLE
jgi:hypothetical protein